MEFQCEAVIGMIRRNILFLNINRYLSFIYIGAGRIQKGFLLPVVFGHHHDAIFASTSPGSPWGFVGSDRLYYPAGGGAGMRGGSRGSAVLDWRTPRQGIRVAGQYPRTWTVRPQCDDPAGIPSSRGTHIRDRWAAPGRIWTRISQPRGDLPFLL